MKSEEQYFNVCSSRVLGKLQHSTGHPLIKKVCQHKQNLILEYLSTNVPCYRIGE